MSVVVTPTTARTPHNWRPLRIAQITATFPPYHGGTGNVCYYNSRELGKLGHQVHVFTRTLKGLPAQEKGEGFMVHRLRPLIRIGNAPVLPGLLKELRGFDIIHLHYPFFGGELSALSAVLHGVPLVITYHQDVLLTGVLGVVENILSHTTGRMTLRSAAKLLFTSTDYATYSNARPLLKGREAIIGELPNGVDITIFTPGVPRLDLLARYKLEPQNRIALLVAALDRPHYFKGVNVFLDAMELLPPSYKGLIVGEGELRQEYEKHAEELGIKSRITFVGRVSQEELPDYYRLAHITILPSTTRGEAFGMVLLESLACGIPVIATDMPGVRTVVEPGRDGLLVTPGDLIQLSQAIEQLLESDALRQTMGIQGRARVEEHYNWLSLISRLEKIYFQALSEAGTDRRGLA